MTDHQQFLDERDKIDFLIQKGCRISGVREHLNGASIDFLHPNGNVTETIQIGTANGRKYFSSILINQKQANS